MNDTVFIGLVSVAMMLVLFSSIMFFLVKKAEYGISELMQHSVGYWYKNLADIVPQKWIVPIYYSAFAGVFLMIVSVIFYLAVVLNS